MGCPHTGYPIGSLLAGSPIDFIWLNTDLTVRVNANRSSACRDKMYCRFCKSGEIESQEYLEFCTGTTHKRHGLNTSKPNKKLILWKKINSKLKDLDDKDTKTQGKMHGRNEKHAQKNC